MTFKVNQQECYVYITLPEQVKPVTAGRFVLRRSPQGVSLGRFVYGKQYLERKDALALDPVALKLTNQVYETTTLSGIFGALRDAGPDYWGRHLIQRHCNRHDLNELDYLLYSPEDRIGALGFGLNVEPPAPIKRFNKTIDLEKLQWVADAMVKDEDYPDGSINMQAEDIMLIGTSMGGARPKAVVEDKEGLWIAKFNRFDDKWNQARVEHAMLILARECGLTVANSKLTHVGGKDVLLVKRFDREKSVKGYLRSRMVSALTLLGGEDTHGSRERWSYVSLVEILRQVSVRPIEDAKELFKRMCFNALISNVDDHPRNHALVAHHAHWQLSPAYDLTPFTPIAVERRDLAMICGDEGRYARASNLLSQHKRFLLSREQAVAIIDDMEQRVKCHWYGVARKVGVSERDCEKIAPAFVYKGFSI